MSYRCKVCGAKTGTVSIPRDPNAHYWRISSSKAATCTEDGFIERVCQISYNLNDKGYDCEVHSYTEELPATGHNYATLEDSAAGHGFDGLLYKKCTKCGDEIKEVRKGEEHDYEKISESSPDCTSEGITKYRCKICGDEYEEKTPALGHNFVEKERVEATDSADGYVLSVCSRCGEEKRDVLSSCEHDFDAVTNASTCEKAGESVKTCKKCGAVVKETIPPLGHEYETQMEVKPSCESDGYKREKCARCGKINTVLIPRDRTQLRGKGRRACVQVLRKRRRSSRRRRECVRAARQKSDSACGSRDSSGAVCRSGGACSSLQEKPEKKEVERTLPFLISFKSNLSGKGKRKKGLRPFDFIVFSYAEGAQRCSNAAPL